MPAIIKHALTLLVILLAAMMAQAAETKLWCGKPVAELFPLSDVRLLDPELLKIRQLDHQYLLALDSDRLLRNYRENFGIKTGIPELTGHEAGTGAHAGARGHYTGHYLSACAMMIASTGDPKLKAKADTMVAELAKLQQPNGYLSAQPEKYFDDLERNPAGRHIVWYCQHKLLAGLLDMYVQAGNAQALEVAKKFGDWVVVRTGKIDHDLIQKILHWEFGGIGEAMANLAAITGDARYLSAARCFDHDEVLKPLAAGEDILKGHHGNTEIPKFIAAAREYELTGEESYRKASAFFWQQVALHRSYVTGGNTAGEGFRTPPDVLSNVINAGTQESCNTYNMLKLTEHVFGWNPRADAGDYYERALYNHILATPHSETGMPLYFLGLAPGQWKVHFAPHQSFWCCAGTGLENFSKLQRGIYYHGKDQLWVNLFIASELDWKEKGVTIRQQTAFPNEPGTTLLVHANKPTALKIHIRVPYWTKGASIEVNGEPLKVDLKPGSFATIDRNWKDGDTVKVSLPMSVHLQPTPDTPNVAAVMYGPVVLAGELGAVSKEKVQVQPDEYNGNKKFQADPYSDAGKLALAGVTEKIADWLEPVPGKPLTFKTKGVGRPQDFVLSPFYRLFDQRYNVYWKLQPPTAATGKQKRTGPALIDN